MEEYTPFMKQKRSRTVNTHRLCVSCLCLALLLLILIAAATGAGLLAHFLISSGDTGRPISLQDILNSSFQALGFSGGFTSGDEILSISKKGLELFNITANTTNLLLNLSVWEGLQADGWSLSPSRSYLLLARNTQKLYRHSYTADFSLLQLSSGSNYSIPGGQWRVVQWTHSDQLVLVNETGMYYIGDVTPSSVGQLALLRASNGGELVGYPDWVYEEEILSSGSAVWASDDSDPTLAYLVSNSSGVPEATITEYGADTGAYPSYRRIPYPKAGDTESSVQLWLIQTADSSNCQIVIPAEYHYVQSVQWSNATHLAVRFLNRQQTQISLVLYNTTCDLLSYLHNYTTAGWVESTVLESIFLPEGLTVSLLPLNGYTQLAIISSNSSVTQLTFGNEVRSLLAVSSKVAFYTTANYSYETHLYAVSLTDSSQVTCVSCQLSDQLTETEVANRECKVISAVFSTTARYFELTCHGPDTPFSLLMNSSSLSVIKVLETNSALQKTLSSVSLPTVEPFKFNGGSHTFYGTRMTPVGFPQSGSYPVLLYVYGGPNSNLASLSHPLSPFSGFIAHLVSSLGFVVITVEGRGTCCRGQDYRFLVKHRLGVLEAEDQSSLSSYLLSQQWVKSVSIMGASYGGYLSGMTSSEDSASLAAAVVISPVTDWRYYDSVYTQRYMGTPQANPQGYKNSSLVLRASGIAGSELLLIHGSADDNVHYQNSAELSLALKKHGQQFRMHTYFDENHHLRREGTREHLYKLIEEFLVEKSL